MNILLVEDDLALASALGDSLRRQNYAVNTVHTGKDALAAVKQAETDMVVLDLGLPDMDGLQVLKTLRSRDATLPVLILTARDSMNDKILGLDGGADDYLPKPFDMAELFARLRVLERRMGNATSSSISLHGVALNLAEHTVSVNDQPLSLPRREFMVLRILMENAGRVLSKQQFESKLYEWGDEVASNTIEVHISNLRKKLPDSFIKTIRGVGYTTPKG
ncbi:response regulator transcription factor [Aestuariibacter sp. GS-14]|uniref:response regulator transcription factor n=1 Tax=Aestuariibacter sp. GS-14 TaxID=2590670 RepID=UPI00112AE22E|nr:response regulator transcription factor [Aestuariibacter sp. GS-14]TPV55379.1 response regulator transcription factor [Aestuariibacter sp. GS-14]